ncbi:hypothetical protein M1O19_00790 [Dehalococcoidia bacterium]|nr:hypothetical protein [Dehalococcoidia bacterium]MCL0097063.1 hypothetical protein [Dehalococcoidia bacterium]
MHRLFAEGFTINQAAGVRLVIRIVFDDFPLKNADEDFIEGETVCLGFFVGAVGNPYSIASHCVNDVFDIQLGLPFQRAT